MFRHKRIEEQLVDEQQKRELLSSQILRNKADMDYIAMMTDIDLDCEEESENE